MNDKNTKVLMDNAIIALNNILSIKELPNFGSIPSYFVTNSRIRPGISVDRAWFKVLEKKKDLGLFVGTLPDGSKNYDDEIIREIIKAIVDEITIYSKVYTADFPGTDVVIATPGGPLYGKTTKYSFGGGIIQ
jgi:hypothetical protein